jgi:hypothetical protein
MRRLRLHPENHLIGRIGWLRAAVLGANDGIISTASLIVGVAAAAATPHDVMIAGVGPAFGFGPAFFVGPALWCHYNWGYGGFAAIQVNSVLYNKFNKVHLTGGGQFQNWKFDPGHRGNVQFKNTKLQQQYGNRGKAIEGGKAFQGGKAFEGGKAIEGRKAIQAAVAEASKRPAAAVASKHPAAAVAAVVVVVAAERPINIGSKTPFRLHSSISQGFERDSV